MREAAKLDSYANGRGPCCWPLHDANGDPVVSATPLSIVRRVYKPVFRALRSLLVAQSLLEYFQNVIYKIMFAAFRSVSRKNPQKPSLMRLSSKNTFHDYLLLSSPDIQPWNVLLFLDTAKHKDNTAYVGRCFSLAPKSEYVAVHEDCSGLCSSKTFIKPTDALRRCLSKKPCTERMSETKNRVLFLLCWWAWSIRLASAAFYTPRRSYSTYMLLAAASAYKISSVLQTSSPLQHTARSQETKTQLDSRRVFSRAVSKRGAPIHNDLCGRNAKQHKTAI